MEAKQSQYLAGDGIQSSQRLAVKKVDKENVTGFPHVARCILDYVDLFYRVLSLGTQNI